MASAWQPWVTCKPLNNKAATERYPAPTAVHHTLAMPLHPHEGYNIVPAVCLTDAGKVLTYVITESELHLQPMSVRVLAPSSVKQCESKNSGRKQY